MFSISQRISRRTLLKSGGAAGLGLVLPEMAQARAQPLQSHLRRSSYTPLIGRSFTVEGAPYRLRLVAVQDLNRAQAGSEDAFTLVFRARPGAARLAHAVPVLHQRRLGSFRLLLSPGMASATGQPYVAIINRSHA